jgi:signal transduction histidine kinase
MPQAGSPGDEVVALLKLLYRSSAAIVQTDLDGQVQLMSAAAARYLMPLSPAGDLERLFEVLAPWVPGLAERVRAPMPDGTVCERVRFTTPAPDNRILELDATQVGQGQLIVLLHDVTSEVRSRQREHEALATQIQRLGRHLDRAVSVAGILVMRTDLGTGAVTVDPVVSRVPSPVPLPANVAVPLERLVHADDLGAYREDMAQAARTGECAVRDFRLRDDDGGDPRWMTGRHFVEADAEGRPAALITFAVDVTAQRAARAAAERQRAAEALSAAKSQFLASIGHEIRTPLNAVVGFTDTLLDPAADPLSVPQRARLQHVRAAGLHLLALVEDLLDATALEQGRVVMRPEAMDACAALRSAAALAGALDVAHGTRLIDDVPPQPVMVQADPTRLHQVLVNLLSNAFKYNRPGGTVSISVHAQGEHVVLTVADTGAGIAADRLQQLFQPFNRLGRERGTQPGLGLGLSITRQLVQAMGGQIDVHSAEGVGTTFTVQLPRATAAHGHASAAPPVRANASRPFEVLAVEDNPVNQEPLRAVFQGRPDVRLRLVAGAAEAIGAALDAPPDLLLLDLELPDLGGWDLLRRLREQPGLAALRTVITSANADARDHEAALRLGAEAYLVKPLTASRVLGVVDQLLSHRGG